MVTVVVTVMYIGLFPEPLTTTFSFTTLLVPRGLLLPEFLSSLLLFAGGGVIGTTVMPAGPAPFVGVVSGLSLAAAGNARIDVGVGCA